MDKKRVRMLITGRVQGVCFRAYTCEEAKQLDLKGYVRNLPDGRVEVLAEGAPPAVEKLKSYCRQGPPVAHVLDLEVREEEAETGKALLPFHITY